MSAPSSCLSPATSFAPALASSATSASGPAGEALRQAAVELRWAETSGQPHAMALALGGLARAYRGLGEFSAAEGLYGQALRWSHALGAVDPRVDLLCALCECAADLAEAHDDGGSETGSGHAARERARDHAHAASTLAGRVSDPLWEIQVLLRISDVLDRCGDRDDAVSLQTRAMRLMAGGGAAPALPDLATMPAQRPAD